MEVACVHIFILDSFYVSSLSSSFSFGSGAREQHGFIARRWGLPCVILLTDEDIYRKVCWGRRFTPSLGLLVSDLDSAPLWNTRLGPNILMTSFSLASAASQIVRMGLGVSPRPGSLLVKQIDWFWLGVLLVILLISTFDLSSFTCSSFLPSS